MTVHTLRLGIEDQITRRYLTVPFALTGAPSVEVTLSYDRSRGVIDLGCEGPAGWRGWSGGARTRFVIAAGAATPGYRPGELEDGDWAVVLGLHQLPAAGLEVRVEMTSPATGAVEEQELLAARPGPPPGSARALPAPPGLTWYAGDFHAHTHHSDGSESIDRLAARAAAVGLDFLAVTDHNTTSHHPLLPAAAARHGVCLIPGQEVTTARGHANAFGDIGFVDFRAPAASWVTEVHARGGVLSVNHPVDADCAWQHPLPQTPPALELWHSSWLREPASTFGWAFWRRWPAGTVPLGGSDFHRPGQGITVGAPTTWVAAHEPTPEAILEGVLAGRTAVSIGTAAPAGVSGAPLLLRVEEDLHAVDAAGTVLVDQEGRRRRITGDRERVPASWGEGVVHLEDADRHLLALC